MKHYVRWEVNCSPRSNDIRLTSVWFHLIDISATSNRLSCCLRNNAQCGIKCKHCSLAFEFLLFIWWDRGKAIDGKRVFHEKPLIINQNMWSWMRWKWLCQAALVLFCGKFNCDSVFHFAAILYAARWKIVTWKCLSVWASRDEEIKIFVNVLTVKSH